LKLNQATLEITPLPNKILSSRLSTGTLEFSLVSYNEKPPLKNTIIGFGKFQFTVLNMA
jgi:hypothetical protein